SFLSADASPTAPYTPSLHDALPIFCWLIVSKSNWVTRVDLYGVTSISPAILSSCSTLRIGVRDTPNSSHRAFSRSTAPGLRCRRSEEHTSELQSRFELVCRLLLETK